jgi:hypothetical protein
MVLPGDQDTSAVEREVVGMDRQLGRGVTILATIVRTLAHETQPALPVAADDKTAAGRTRVDDPVGATESVRVGYPRPISVDLHHAGPRP